MKKANRDDNMKMYNSLKAYYNRFLYESTTEYKGFNKKYSLFLYDKTLEILNEELKVFLKEKNKYMEYIKKNKKKTKEETIKNILNKIANGTFGGTEREKKNIIDYIKNKMSEIDKNEVKKRKKINDMLE